MKPSEAVDKLGLRLLLYSFEMILGPEGGAYIFLRSVGISPSYIALQLGRLYCRGVGMITKRIISMCVCDFFGCCFLSVLFYCGRYGAHFSTRSTYTFLLGIVLLTRQWCNIAIEFLHAVDILITVFNYAFTSTRVTR
jgi:hypothetical protein